MIRVFDTEFGTEHEAFYFEGGMIAASKVIQEIFARGGRASWVDYTGAWTSADGHEGSAGTENHLIIAGLHGELPVYPGHWVMYRVADKRFFVHARNELTPYYEREKEEEEEEPNDLSGYSMLDLLNEIKRRIS